MIRTPRAPAGTLGISAPRGDFCQRSYGPDKDPSRTVVRIDFCAGLWDLASGAQGEEDQAGITRVADAPLAAGRNINQISGRDEGGRAGLNLYPPVAVQNDAEFGSSLQPVQPGRVATPGSAVSRIVELARSFCGRLRIGGLRPLAAGRPFG